MIKKSRSDFDLFPPLPNSELGLEGEGVSNSYFASVPPPPPPLNGTAVASPTLCLNHLHRDQPALLGRAISDQEYPGKPPTDTKSLATC